MDFKLYIDNSLRRKEDPLLAAGLIGGVGSLIGSLFSSGSNAAAVNATNRANMAINKMNNQFNHDENTLAYNRQRQLISEQNEYNSFANQRKLMEQAGYNPNNLVGGTAGTAVSSSSTATNAASAAPSHAMQAPDLSALGNIANIGLTTAQAKLMEAQAKKVGSETEGQELSNAYQEMQNAVYELYGKQQAIANLNLTDAQAALADNQRYVQKTIEALNNYDLHYLKPSQLALVSAQGATEILKQGLTKVQTAKTEVERISILKTLGAQLALYSAQTYYYSQQARYTGNQADLIEGPKLIGSSFGGLIPKFSSGGPLYQRYLKENQGIDTHNVGFKLDNMLKSQNYQYLDEYNELFLRNLLTEVHGNESWDKKKYGDVLTGTHGHLVDDFINGIGNAFYQIVDLVRLDNLFK